MASIEPHYIKTFMGADFRLGDVKNIRDLRRELGLWIEELNGWGDDTMPISECTIVKGYLSVTLEEGIVQ